MKNLENESAKELRQLREIVRIVSAAGGELHGRSKLKNIAYLLDLGGLGCGYQFEYNRYGLYSEELEIDASYTRLFFDFQEERRPTNGTGKYSVFISRAAYRAETKGNDVYKQLVTLTKDQDPFVLEMTADAAYFGKDGHDDPWKESERRNSLVSGNGMLQISKDLYGRLKRLPLPQSLPDI